MPELQGAAVVVGLYPWVRAVKNLPSLKPDLTGYLGQAVTVRIDRPMGSVHPRFADMVYPVNYGFLPGTMSGDGAEIDAYVLGIDIPVTEAMGRVVAIIERMNDNEDKLIVAGDGKTRAENEIYEAVAFCERYFSTRIIIAD